LTPPPAGLLSPQMKEIVAKLTVEDMVSITAYTASPTPWPTSSRTSLPISGRLKRGNRIVRQAVEYSIGDPGRAGEQNTTTVDHW